MQQKYAWDTTAKGNFSHEEMDVMNEVSRMLRVGCKVKELHVKLRILKS